ncbi:hypothetical protein AVEN_168979-1, partial [Araneus ventricosus]
MISVAKVHYVDYGDTEGWKKKYLENCKKDFLLDESFSVQCHLDGIIPAGAAQTDSIQPVIFSDSWFASHEHLSLLS